MKLTGQCLKDFEKWLLKQNYDNYCGDIIWGVELEDFIKLPLAMQYGVLIDFFDSVGIWVSIDKGTNGYYGLLKITKGRILESQWVNTEMNWIKDLNKAIEKAIEKATEIYNQ